MAEKSGELKHVDGLDPLSKSAGADSDAFIEKYEADGSLSSSEASVSEAPPETEQLKAQIEETRNQMGETIDAIQERLSFANISDQVSETVSSAIETAKDTAYKETIGKAVNFMKNVGDGVSHSNAARTIRKNPLPIALIGVGAGLLAYQAFAKQKAPRLGNGRFSHDDGNPGRISAATAAIGDASGRAYEGISNTASHAVDSVKSVAGNAYEGVSGAITTAYSKAGDATHQAYERAGELGTMAHEKYDEYLEENPLALGAVALAIGAAVGFAVPSTRYEGRLMGDARENLVQRAQDAAGSFVDKAKQVASEAGQTIKDEIS